MTQVVGVQVPPPAPNPVERSETRRLGLIEAIQPKKQTNMQVTQTNSDGLKREFQVVVPTDELDSKVNQRLIALKDRVRIKGFRPGKVPLEHLKRVYGRSVRGEAIEAAVQEANAKIVSENNFRLAMEPKINLPEEEGKVKDVIEGRADLAYTVALEILPQITLADFKGLSLDRPVAQVAESEIDAAVAKIGQQNQPFQPKGEDAKAETGDRVVISFTGTMDGQPFEGGSATDITVEIGSNTFIPGFEGQLIGIGVGETRTVNARFPDNYGAANLAGKDASFEVNATGLLTPQTVTIDDDLAKSLGMESIAKLRDAVKERIAKEHSAASRQRVKRQLLDLLDEKHQFDLPPTLVEEEFNSIWQTINSDLQSQNRSFEDEDTTEEAALADYRKIAARRVRLGLVLAEIGEKNNIKVTDEEVSRMLVERVRQFPGQEQQVWDYYRKNPQALASVRAPLYEEKVVDFILELAKVTEKSVSSEELYKEEAAPA